MKINNKEVKLLLRGKRKRPILVIGDKVYLWNDKVFSKARLDQSKYDSIFSLEGYKKNGYVIKAYTSNMNSPNALVVRVYRPNNELIELNLLDLINATYRQNRKISIEIVKVINFLRDKVISSLEEKKTFREVKNSSPKLIRDKEVIPSVYCSLEDTYIPLIKCKLCRYANLIPVKENNKIITYKVRCIF
jgi:hypothetical protein